MADLREKHRYDLSKVPITSRWLDPATFSPTAATKMFEYKFTGLSENLVEVELKPDVKTFLDTSFPNRWAIIAKNPETKGIFIEFQTEEELTFFTLKYPYV